MTLLTSLIFSVVLSAHPMHFSYTNVEIDTFNNKITVSSKFFINDFNLLFYHLYEKNIEPQKDQAFSNPDLSMVDGYYRDRLTLLSDQDTIALQFIRKEQDDESIWLFYESRLPSSKMKSLILNNLLLLDLYMDQKNLVIISSGNREKGITFDFENRRAVMNMVEL
jgi:hypothetical protein